jgi:hypothetical protein
MPPLKVAGADYLPDEVTQIAAIATMYGQMTQSMNAICTYHSKEMTCALECNEVSWSSCLCKLRSD